MTGGWKRGVAFLPVAAILFGLAGCSYAASSGTSRRSATPIGAATKTVTHSRSVTFHGITFRLPAGWNVAQPRCGPPANDTVVRGVWTGSCPGGSGGLPPTTAVTLTTLYGRQFALGWAGRRTTWRGQPAWRSQQRSHGLDTTSLTLPWLNAAVTAQSGDPSLLPKLIAMASPHHPRAGLTVPAAASSVFIQSLAGTDGDHQQRNARITDPADGLRPAGWWASRLTSVSTRRC